MIIIEIIRRSRMMTIIIIIIINTYEVYGQYRPLAPGAQKTDNWH